LRKHAYRPGKSGNEAGPRANQPRAAAQLLYETYRAKREKLLFEQESGSLISVAVAIDIFGRQNAEVRNAVMALGKHARSRIPHLTVDDVAVVESLCRECLEGLAAGAIKGG